MKKNILFLLMGIVFVLTITGCENKESTIENKGEKKQIKLKEDLAFEINEELKLLSLISENNEVEILSEDEIIDTSKLGEYEITIKYKDKEKEKEQIVKITIIDTIAPTIEYQKELLITEGKNIDLLANVKVTDNSKEEIIPTVEGTYDINKVGTYNLKYVAVDSSNNKTIENFTLKVDKKVIKYIKVVSETLYFGKYKMEGDIPSEYTGTITINADGTASSTGYYYNSKGRFEKKNLTGKWSFEKNSVAGLEGAPSDLTKVNGIYFSWSNGETLGYGLSTKYFGDQFHGYRWYSY